MEVEELTQKNSMLIDSHTLTSLQVIHMDRHPRCAKLDGVADDAFNVYETEWP